MELLRILGALIEPPGPDHQRMADLLELGPVPSPAEHTALFDFQLYPYASVYLGAEGQLGGEARDRIAGFWRALGETPPAEPDHLTVMLALQAQLGEQETQGDKGQRACRAFLWEHLLSWLPVYLDKLEDLAPSYYCRWSALLRETFGAEVERLGRQERLSLHLRQAPALADPRQEGAAAFLDSLLSPARYGLILVRDDLIRAGRELGLGVRAGERRFVLKALLDQEPAATLAWLGRECQARESRYAENGLLLGPVAGFWTDRARASVALLDELSREADM